MFDPECLCSKHAALINVRLASSEAKDMTFILGLRIVSGEAGNCMVGCKLRVMMLRTDCIAARLI